MTVFIPLALTISVLNQKFDGMEYGPIVTNTEKVFVVFLILCFNLQKRNCGLEIPEP